VAIVSVRLLALEAELATFYTQQSFLYELLQLRESFTIKHVPLLPHPKCPIFVVADIDQHRCRALHTG